MIDKELENDIKSFIYYDNFVEWIEGNKKIEYQQKALIKYALDEYISEKLAGVIEQDRTKYDDMPLENMDMTVRSYNCLLRAGYRTFGDIKNLTEEDLKKIRNLGNKSFREIRQIVAKYSEGGR